MDDTHHLSKMPAPRPPAHRGLLIAALLTSIPLVMVPACASQTDGDPSTKPIDPRGYQPRACGFDLDDDGIVGERDDDCRICNGVDTDPDGDGIAEDLLYVDCAAGTDSPDCGSPSRPCATIGYAWAQRADGPGDGAEDVVCFRGACREELLDPGFGGVEGYHERPAEGSQARAWRYPSNPAMLVGWDADHDGAYPPFDRDDLAVLEGRGLSRAFDLGPESRNLELAHFTARDYGLETDADDTGFVRFGPRGGDLDHLYFHDLHLERINRARPPGSKTSAINLFTHAARLHWVQFSNLLVTENGAWFTRGAGPKEGAEVGPFRWQNVTRTGLGCNFADCGNSAASTAFKIWGYVGGIEILDSVWDANVGAWQPKPQGGPPGSRFVLASQCSRDWVIRGNLTIDYKNVLKVQAYSPTYCTGAEARPVDGVVFERNEVRNGYEPWSFGDIPVIVMKGGDDPGETAGSVTITNNHFSSTVGWETCIWIYSGNDAAPPPGKVVVTHNTCYGRVTRHAGIVFGNVQGSDAVFPQQQVVFEGNVIAGVGGGQPNVETTYEIEGLSARDNVYDPEGLFRWNGELLPNLEAWRGALPHGDPGSKICNPAFVDVQRGDVRLAVGDPCAQGRGPQPPGPRPK